MSSFPRLRLGFAMVVLFVVIGGAFRYLFFSVFADGTSFSTNTLAHSFYVGLKFDIRLAVLVVVPFFALAWIKPLNPKCSRNAAKLWSAHFAAVSCLLVLTYLADLGHYDYLQTRLNASAFRFMENPLISLQMVWQTYSIVPAVILLAVVGTSTYLLVRRLLSDGSPSISRLAPTYRRLIVGVATMALIAGIYGKISYYPLRWSDAYFSTDSFPAALALNPALNMVDTFATSEQATDAAASFRSNYDRLADYLSVEDPNREMLNLSRRVTPTPLSKGRPNVVVIMMESFAAHLTGFYGNPLSASPEFDRIAEKGIAFTRFYTPSVGTAHGVYTMLTGIPDVSLNRTASRNPNAIKQHIILNDFAGYEKFYFLGGSANWANIRALLQHNIADLKLYEEGDFPNSPRTDVWGISDLHLFDEANKVIRDTEQPFFAFVHLSGNHRPYTIPSDNRGFEFEVIDEEVALENGFDKEDGFNSFRFMDHSLGFFMEQAAKEEYFDNTIFILTADNGEIGKVPGPLHSEEAPRLSYHHAPFVIYGPSINRPAERIDTIGTQMDILPTIAGAVGIPARNLALGRNLLDPDNPSGLAFIHRRWGGGSELVALEDNYMLTNKRGQKPTELHSYQSEVGQWQLVEDETERVEEMTNYADSFYDAANHLMFGTRK